MATAKRRLTTKDKDDLKDFVNDTLEQRKSSEFRKTHEEHWREVDRQIQMKPPGTFNRSGNADEDWHNAIQLGLLADALEIIAADVQRLTFPGDRSWFTPHIQLKAGIDPNTGKAVIDPREQKTSDGVLRSLMVQQHQDFGFKNRVKLSVKEALQHGGYVAECMWQTMAKFHVKGSQELAAPVWQPHSMWNCYPDTSPIVIGTDLIYRGSMIICESMRKSEFMQIQKYSNKKEVQDKSDGKGNKNMVELKKFYGDVTLPRSQGEDMFTPNMLVIFANDILVFADTNDTPGSPIIYSGYERDDVRDPYYTSPIIKRAPTAQMATQSANGYLDLVDLHREPPGAFEQHDTYMSQNEGPVIAPGKMNPATGAANMKLFDLGDPNVALQGLQWAIQEVEKGTGSNAVRQGVTQGNELTATEIVKADQRSELRTVDFVAVLEGQGLRPFLYMQHELNLLRLKNYPFYNDEIHTPDTLVWSKKDLNERPSMFEITGSRSLLGEEQRIARFRDMAGFVLSSEVLMEKSNIDEILKQGWDDARVKDPERMLLSADPDIEARLAEQEQLFTAQIAELQQELQKFTLMQEQHAMEKAGLQAQVQRQTTDTNTFRELLRLMTESRQSEDRLRGILREVQSGIQQAQAEAEGAGEDRLGMIERQLGDIASAFADIETKRQKRVDSILQQVQAIDADTSRPQ